MQALLADIKAGNTARLKAGTKQIPFGQQGLGLVKYCCGPSPGTSCPHGPAVIDDMPEAPMTCPACGRARQKPPTSASAGDAPARGGAKGLGDVQMLERNPNTNPLTSGQPVSRQSVPHTGPRFAI